MILTHKKTVSRFLISGFLGFSIASVFFSCKNEKTAKTISRTASVEHTQTSTLESEKKQTVLQPILDINTTTNTTVFELRESSLQQLLNLYLEVKKYLVNGDTKEANKVFKQIKTNVLTIKKEHPNWVSGTLEANLMLISITKDLEQMRSFFVTFSEQMIVLLGNGNLTSGAYYIQHCPMAKQGEGASWISNSKEIRNPFFGSKMLDCGVIEKTVTVTPLSSK